MFGQKKRDNEEQLKKLEATIQDYQEKLAKAEETIKQKEKALENIKSQQLSPEEIAEKRLAKKRNKSNNRTGEQGKRDINVFALVDAQLDAHKKKEHREMLESILSDLILDPLVGYKKDEKWFQYLDLINIETLSIIIRDSDLPIDLKKQIAASNPNAQVLWIEMAMDDSIDIYTRMQAAEMITDKSLIPDTQKQRCAEGNHLWVDAGSMRQQYQFGPSSDHRKCIYCGEELHEYYDGD